MSTARLAAAASPLVALVLLLGVTVTMIDSSEEPATTAAGCVSSGPAVVVNLASLPRSVVAGGVTYRAEQLANAAAVIRAGADAGLDVHGQTVGVMTAIGESSLVNVDRGDAVGPDSRGLFQQRANGAWGTYAERMDPYTAATSFFRALQRVPGWASLSPTLAAHRTQRNADPNHYARFWDDAQAIVAALGGAQVATPCAPGSDIVVPAGSWVRPVVGRVTSGFGPRWGTVHRGLDFGAPCGTPIVAAAAGTVIGAYKNNRPPATGYGTLVVIDHGGGVVTRYAHAPNEGVFVRAGQQVRGGQRIAEVGTYGNSTGCHLHWEVERNGVKVDPAALAREVGIPL